MESSTCTISVAPHLPLILASLTVGIVHSICLLSSPARRLLRLNPAYSDIARLCCHQYACCRYYKYRRVDWSFPPRLCLCVRDRVAPSPHYPGIFIPKPVGERRRKQSALGGTRSPLSFSSPLNLPDGAQEIYFPDEGTCIRFIFFSFPGYDLGSCHEPPLTCIRRLLPHPCLCRLTYPAALVDPSNITS